MNLILDLDGTLVNGFYNVDNNNIFSIIERPFLSVFFKFVFANFKNVSVWTHGSQEWFNICYTKILKRFIPFGKSFHFVITSDHGFSPNLVEKDLRKVYIRHNEYNRSNTFIVDDTPITYRLNRENAIPIKSYTGDYFNQCYYGGGSDYEFLNIMVFFKKYVFKQPTPQVVISKNVNMNTNTNTDNLIEDLEEYDLENSEEMNKVELRDTQNANAALTKEEINTLLKSTHTTVRINI